jgi:hypothetical protein
VQVRRDDRGLHRLAVDDVRDQVGGQVVQGGGFVLVDAAGEECAQRERVRATGDVSGAVGGVLDGVVEEEGLVLAPVPVQFSAGEELGDGGGGERGEAGAEVADGVEGAAGGALVAFRGAVAVEVSSPADGVLRRRPGC